jgi:hypothetical protein
VTKTVVGGEPSKTERGSRSRQFAHIVLTAPLLPARAEMM